MLLNPTIRRIGSILSAYPLVNIVYVPPPHHNTLPPGNTCWSYQCFVPQQSLEHKAITAILEPHDIDSLHLLFEIRDNTREPGEGQEGCGYELRYNQDFNITYR